MVRGWNPQPGLNIHPNLWPGEDAVGNVSVVYISRGHITHLFRSNDPIFKATEEVPLPKLSVGYVSNWEDRVSAIACVEKLQLCVGKKKAKTCSPWTGVVRGENGETGSEEFNKTLSSDDRGITFHASSVLPFMRSHRGDSGTKQVMISIRIGQISASPRGPRHCADTFVE